MKMPLTLGVSLLLMAMLLTACNKEAKSTSADEAAAGEIQPLSEPDYGAGTAGSGGFPAAAAPSAATAATPYPPAAAPLGGAGRTHTVRRGDTLWSIAQRSYGDGKRWREIAAANPGVEPTRLKVGQTLVLP